MSYVVKAITLKAPADEGLMSEDNFDVTEETITEPELPQGAIFIQLLVLSADPYMRGQMKSTGSIKAGQVIPSFVAGKVLRSNQNSKWNEGDFFGAILPMKTYQVLDESALASVVMWKLDISEAEISLGVGLLGMPGSTAYGGLIDVLRPKEGETIFVSAAAGAVGSLVGMLAKKLFNCTVIGSCGSDEKCELIKSKFGYDHAINYKRCNNANDLVEELKKVAPKGIDMYFENVGGMHFEAAIETLRAGGRVAVCGQISEYNTAKPSPCVIYPMKMIYTAQRIEGFVCMPWLKGIKGNFHQDMTKWFREGLVVAEETNFAGIEQWPAAFRSLFEGSNTGKVVVRL